MLRPAAHRRQDCNGESGSGGCMIIKRDREVQFTVAAQEGFRRLNRLSVYLVGCSLAGLTIWLIEFFTVGRWGLGDLTYLIFPPLVMALSLRILSWLLAGFFQNPPDSHARSSPSDTRP
jgi:hypothetical protein